MGNSREATITNKEARAMFLMKTLLLIKLVEI